MSESKPPRIYNSQPPRIYNSRDVRERMGNRSMATLYRWMSDPRYNFPKPRKTGSSRSNMWDAHEVDAWLEQQLTQPQNQSPVPMPVRPQSITVQGCLYRIETLIDALTRISQTALIAFGRAAKAKSEFAQDFSIIDDMARRALTPREK